MNVFEMQENNIELNARQQKFIDNYNFFENINDYEEKYNFALEYITREEHINNAWFYWENKDNHFE